MLTTESRTSPAISIVTVSTVSACGSSVVTPDDALSALGAAISLNPATATSFSPSEELTDAVRAASNELSSSLALSLCAGAVSDEAVSWLSDSLLDDASAEASASPSVSASDSEVVSSPSSSASADSSPFSSEDASLSPDLLSSFFVGGARMAFISASGT